MRVLVLGGLALLGGFLGGCATVIEGGGQDVTVASTPPGASCTVDRKGERLGTVSPTPGQLRLDKSKNELLVSCSKTGFLTTQVTQAPKFVGTTFGNLLLGGGVGFIVDAATGANYAYPKEVAVVLPPTTPAVPPGPAEQPIVLRPPGSADAGS